MTLPKRCLDCPAITRNGSRCPTCERAHNRKRHNRVLYDRADYRRRAARVRANATRCWRCGLPILPGQPVDADHVNPGDPNSPLLPTHASCNRGKRQHPTNTRRTQ
jgi:hypothetical protein